jgi:hypothetical protein
MRASLCLGVAVGLMAFGALSAANAFVGGSAIEASRPALSLGTMIHEARWFKKRHCNWHNHRRHCWWS